MGKRRIRAALFLLLIAPPVAVSLTRPTERPAADFKTAVFAVAKTAGLHDEGTQTISGDALTVWKFGSADCAETVRVAVTDRSFQAKAQFGGVGGADDRRGFVFLGSSSTRQSQGWTLVEQLKQRWLELFSLSPYIIDRNMLMIAQPNDCILPKIEWSKAWDRGFRESLAREKVSVGAR